MTIPDDRPVAYRSARLERFEHRETPSTPVEICTRCVDDKVQKRMQRSLRAMTDTDRIERGSYDDIGGLDDPLDEWDEYSSDDEAEDEYEDFLDWLNDRA